MGVNIGIGAGETSKTPADIELLRPWFPVIRRMRQVSQVGRCTVVTLKIVVDESGIPVKPWLTPTVQGLEPRYDAEDLLRSLLE